MAPLEKIRRLIAGHRERLLLFARMLLGVSLPFFLLGQASLYFDALIERDGRRAATVEAVHRARDLLDMTLKTYTAELRVISRGYALQRLIGGDRAAISDVANSFSAFVSEKPIIAQLRYLDAKGMEIVRVDSGASGAVVVGAAELQDKSQRYFFIDAIDLPIGDIYVSPIDLNIEHNAIETPWAPMLRLAMPMADRGGVKTGVLLINIAAADFIADIDRQRPAGSAPLQLLNEDGYWLSGVPVDRLWGFMFGRETTMARSDPRSWSAITAATEGAFTGPGGEYVFATMRPQAYLSPDGSLRAYHAGDTKWKILGIVPPITAGDILARERISAGLIGIAVLAVVCLGWSRTVMAQRMAEKRRQTVEGELARSERLASLGGLVAGVAHELNTPVGNAVTLSSTLSHAAREFGQAAAAGQIRRSTIDAFVRDVDEGTSMLLRNLERTVELIGHFRRVAVDQTSEQRRAFSLGDLVLDVVTSLQPQFKHGGVVLKTHLAGDPQLDSYPGPLGQVLINLVTNARLHGFDTGQTGEVTVATRDLPSGEAEITVSDTGRGIPPELRQRIFEPFFTTRLGQGGSGLGLSIVFNIVTGLLGGTIHAEAGKSGGCSMVLRLPRQAPAEAGDALKEAYDVKSRSVS